jgi:hypothetical protein
MASQSKLVFFFNRPSERSLYRGIICIGPNWVSHYLKGKTSSKVSLRIKRCDSRKQALRTTVNQATKHFLALQRDPTIAHVVLLLPWLHLCARDCKVGWACLLSVGLTLLKIMISADKFLSSDEAERDNKSIRQSIPIASWCTKHGTGEGVSSEVTSIAFCVIYCLIYLVELSQPSWLLLVMDFVLLPTSFFLRRFYHRLFQPDYTLSHLISSIT